MSENLNLAVVLPAAPETLYAAWMDGTTHSEMTGSPAQIDPRPGGLFSAWDGYITGKTLEIEPPRRILQAWRTTEFTTEDPDSLLEILFASDPLGTRVILHHSQLPDGQGEGYRQGWEDYYFQPMRGYFRAG